MVRPSLSASPSLASKKPECIRLRGVRQNNLKGFDLDLPLGNYVVVTGLSGAGKSSLVFDTLHAEGQRRYVETFSAYTRQFLDLLDKPQVDAIENIRPSIAIEQTNTVKTSRSTVGTMTELTDFFKVWFSHVATCFDPATGKPVEDDTPASIWQKTHASAPDTAVIVAFRVTKPKKLTWHEILTHLKGQSYVRVLTPTLDGHLAVARIDDLLANPEALDAQLAPNAALFVAQDRVTLTADARARFLEAAEQALHFGQGQLYVFSAELSAPSSQLLAPSPLGHYSRGLHSPETGRTFRAASPALFSFNSPLGACPHCKGFGRIIEIDYRLAIPDATLSIDDGAIKCWEGEVYGASKDDLKSIAKRKKIPTNVAFGTLTPEQRDFVINGEPGYGENDLEWPRAWYGVKGFFRWLEKSTYKMHVRVFLSRYRTYNLCPTCHGTRLQPEALCWRWQGKTLPELYQTPVAELLAALRNFEAANPKAQIAGAADAADLALDSIRTRLSYLQQVGLGYLTLDRSSKTLSGGEVQRVNLTSCLGTSLVDTLFVLDEPSVGLHPRDIERLIAIIRTLTDAGNTVVVVEHDEAMIRAADHLIEVGPEPGKRGGHIVFQGELPALLASEASITGRYLSGRETIAAPATRRPVLGLSALDTGHRSLKIGHSPSAPGHPPSVIGHRSLDIGHYSSAPGHSSLVLGHCSLDIAPTPHHWLTFVDANKHNLRNVTLRLPLHRLVALSGVSGSGKSTLLDNVIHQGLLAKRLQLTDDPAVIAAITGDELFDEIVLVDQSPLSRTPRSNPALYTEAWELIRELYAKEPAAKASGFNSSSFSFNSGEGRCDHCQGLGYERVEMQFLSDVFVPCPICEGRRFKPEILAVQWNGLSVSDLLATSVTDALPLFENHAPIRSRLASLESVGLGYLTLGQPLNTLSGGESQRLKLVKYLSGFAGEIPEAKSQKNKSPEPKSPNPKKKPAPSSQLKGALLLLDEPTTGLHRHDVKRLIAVLQALVDRGHSVVVIEHNLDVLKSADWLIEVGPEAGTDGGQIIAEGPPDVVAHAATATAPFLRDALASSEPGAMSLELRATSSHLPSPTSKLSAPSSKLSAPSSQQLVLTGARENNLKNLSLAIAHRQLTVVTGVSGSGKSTLAFDIVFAEGQRRFMESMSPYARQFVEQLPRPAIDRLTGIPPTVAIEQRITRGSRKSTVATITEVAQYLRLLYARLGVQHHPETGKPVQPLTPGQLKKLLATVLASPKATKAKHLYLCAPLIRGRKGHHQPIATWIADHGYELMRADGRLLRVDTFQKLDRYSEHDIEVVVADLKAAGSDELGAKSSKTPTPGSKLKAPSSKLTASDALERALQLGKGSCFIALPNGEVLSWFSTTRTDIETGESFPELDPKQFSHNSPRGWCPTCRGHGRVFPWMLEPVEDNEDDPAARLREFGIVSSDDVADTGTPCPDCHGQRLNRIARAVRIPLRGNFKSHLSNLKFGPSLPELLASTPAQLIELLGALQLDERGRLITQDIVPQIQERLKFLDHVGLGYLAMDRPTDTLSGGEAQRIRLAAQLGTNLAGVLYVLDEPSIGLHARDNDRLIETLLTLRDKGNTLLVVEHDDELMERADHIIDLGPAAGIHGGELLAQGTPAEIKASDKSLTGLFLAKGIVHPLRGSYRPVPAPKSPKNKRA